jgi:hypothetical protein
LLRESIDLAAGYAILEQHPLGAVYSRGERREEGTECNKENLQPTRIIMGKRAEVTGEWHRTLLSRYIGDAERRPSRPMEPRAIVPAARRPGEEGGAAAAHEAAAQASTIATDAIMVVRRDTIASCLPMKTP